MTIYAKNLRGYKPLPPGYAYDVAFGLHFSQSNSPMHPKVRKLRMGVVEDLEKSD